MMLALGLVQLFSCQGPEAASTTLSEGTSPTTGITTTGITPPDTSSPPTDTSDPSTTQTGPDPLWEADDLPVFRLSLPADWEDTLWELVDVDECADREYLEGTVDFENPVTGESEHYESVGVRLRGHSALTLAQDSAEHERAGFKLSFNEFVEGRRFHGLRRVNLLGTEGDYSLMHEVLALQLMRGLGIPAPRTGYALLYINDELMGLYPNSEEPDDEPYLEHHFGDDSGHLYKVEGYCTGRATFQWEGEDPSSYEEFQIRADTVESDKAEDIVPLMSCVNEASDADFAACIPDHILLDEWLLEMAADVAMPDVDGMLGNGQNFLIYSEPASGLFRIWPWDKDQAFTTWNLLSEDTLFDIRPAWGADFHSILGERLLTVERQAFCTHLSTVLEATEPAQLEAEVELLRDQLSAEIDADPFMEHERWGYLVDHILSEAQERHPLLVAEVEACLAESG